ncbi:MAG: hypothetical protein ACR2N5_07520 [Solirubrobacterales bacterium]
MAEDSDYRDTDGDKLRVLFCMGVLPAFFENEPGKVKPIIDALEEAFADLSGRFGIEVLGTMDDDQLMVGPTEGWPWTAYILADAPNLEAVYAVTNIVRDVEIDGYLLWRYVKFEARVGRRLFFGNE